MTGEASRGRTPDQEDRRGERQRAIVWAAAALFDRNGYSETTMDDIAAAVHVTRPTLYKYFSSKGEILYAIHEGFIDLVLARHDRRLDTVMSAPQLLFELMADLLELHETHPGHVRVFFEHHRALALDEQVTIRGKRDRLQESMEALLERGMATGDFRQSDVRILAFGIFGMCNWAYMWYRAGGAYSPREIAQQYWDMVMRGIQVQALGGNS
jgi:AcrR family transcriptional regulator